MELPPPKPMMPSASASFACWRAARTTASGGSATTWVKAAKGRPAAVRAASSWPSMPVLTIPGSVTTRGRPMCCLRQISPRRCRAPSSLMMDLLVLKTKVFTGVSLSKGLGAKVAVGSWAQQPVEGLFHMVQPGVVVQLVGVDVVGHFQGAGLDGQGVDGNGGHRQGGKAQIQVAAVVAEFGTAGDEPVDGHGGTGRQPLAVGD